MPPHWSRTTIVASSSVGPADDHDVATARRVADGVVEEVVQDPRDLLGRRPPCSGSSSTSSTRRTPFRSAWVRAAATASADDLGEAHRPPVELERAAVDPRELEEVVDQGGEPLGVASQLGVVAADGRRDR